MKKNISSKKFSNKIKNVFNDKFSKTENSQTNLKNRSILKKHNSLSHKKKKNLKVIFSDKTRGFSYKKKFKYLLVQNSNKFQDLKSELKKKFTQTIKFNNKKKINFKKHHFLTEKSINEKSYKKIEKKNFLNKTEKVNLKKKDQKTIFKTTEKINYTKKKIKNNNYLLKKKLFDGKKKKNYNIFFENIGFTQNSIIDDERLKINENTEFKINELTCENNNLKDKINLIEKNEKKIFLKSNNTNEITINELKFENINLREIILFLENKQNVNFLEKKKMSENKLNNINHENEKLKEKIILLEKNLSFVEKQKNDFHTNILGLKNKIFDYIKKYKVLKEEKIKNEIRFNQEKQKFENFKIQNNELKQTYNLDINKNLEIKYSDLKKEYDFIKGENEKKNEFKIKYLDLKLKYDLLKNNDNKYEIQKLNNDIYEKEIQIEFFKKELNCFNENKKLKKENQKIEKIFTWTNKIDKKEIKLFQSEKITNLNIKILEKEFKEKKLIDLIKKLEKQINILKRENDNNWKMLIS